MQKLNVQVLAHTIVHTIAFNIKALVVPWYQFVYTLFIPCGRQHSSGLHHWRSIYQQGKGRSLTVPDPDFTEDARRCPNGITHAARLMSAGQYADVHCSATESLPLRQYNLRCHRPAENQPHLAPHSRRDSQSAQPWPQLSLHLPCDKVQRTTAWGNFKHHTEHQKPMIGCNKTGAPTVCANVIFWIALVHM